MPPEEIAPEYDVVIVGSGPAGCTAARYLSDRFKVLMIDRSVIPRSKPCGGLLVEESQQFIKLLEPLEFIFSKPKKVKLKLVDWDNDIEIDVEREYTNVIRNKFDYWLLQLINERVDVHAKTDLLDFFERKDGLNLVISRDNQTKIVKTTYLIGADGPGSIVRKHMSNKPIRTYVAIQESIKSDLNSHAYFVYDQEITDFYSWVIPKGDKLVVGSALAMNNGSIRDKWDLLKKKLEKKYGLKGDYRDRESCLLVRPSSVEDIILGRDNVLLAGEAAGLISPSTSEGISFALRSGRFCAHAINNAKDVGEYYKSLCKPLVDEIADKVLKSNALSDVKRRKKVLENWHAISEPKGHEKAVELWGK